MNPLPDQLHLGCGLMTPDGWLNLDGSWNAWFAKHPRWRATIKRLHLLPASQLDIPWSPHIFIHDVRKGLPFPDESFRAIYSAHFLEHLYRNEADALLKQCYRVLQPGGVIRMVVPDLATLVNKYVNYATEPPSPSGLPPADLLVGRLKLREPVAPAGSRVYQIYNALTDFQTHKWMYDAPSLTFRLQQAGFGEVGQRAYLDSRIADIGVIEQADRADVGHGICVEGIKPLERARSLH